MKVGLFGARADDRGLGRLTHDFYTHMAPDRTLVVDMRPHARGFIQHLDRYGDDATVVPFNNGTFDVDFMRRFFEGLDVAIMYETAYDHRAYDIARAVGCRTVLMSMPEFHRHATERLPHPDVIWVPTTWRLDTIPGARIVPIPVTLDPDRAERPTGKPLRVLHVAGHRAAGDRNGTIPFLRALRDVRSPVAVRVTTQDRLPNVQHVRHLISVVSHVDDHRRLYDKADVLVMPRRYGGLCLPVQEALAAGIGIVMTGCEPNMDTWPIEPLAWRPGTTTIKTPGGPVPLADPDIADITRAIDRLALSPTRVDELRDRARTWAAANSWETLRPMIHVELEWAAEPQQMLA
jgi:hypothetical protein